MRKILLVVAMLALAACTSSPMPDAPEGGASTSGGEVRRIGCAIARPACAVVGAVCGAR